MSALFIVVAAILLLGPLIAIHEFGHYFVARKLGVKVLVYSIGFGPTILNNIYGASGSYKNAFVIAMCFSLVGLALTFVYRKLTKKLA